MPVGDVPGAQAAYDVAALNLDNGIAFIATLLDQGMAEMTAWGTIAQRIRTSVVKQLPLPAAFRFLCNIAAAGQLRLALDPHVPASHYPDLLPGIRLITDKLAAGESELAAWKLVADDTEVGYQGESLLLAISDMADNVAAAQLLIAGADSDRH